MNSKKLDRQTCSRKERTYDTRRTGSISNDRLDVVGLQSLVKIFRREFLPAILAHKLRRQRGGLPQSVSAILGYHAASLVLDILNSQLLGEKMDGFSAHVDVLFVFVHD